MKRAGGTRGTLVRGGGATFTKRIAQARLFAALLASVALRVPGEAWADTCGQSYARTCTRTDCARRGVSGTAEHADVGQTSIGERDSPGGGSGPSARDYALVVGGIAAAVVALTAGVWYVRRRWGW
jgi:hypothetical protein